MNSQKRCKFSIGMIFIVAIEFYLGTFVTGQDNITNVVEVLMKSAGMSQAVSNELEIISQDYKMSPEVRQMANSVIKNHDNRGTNSYEQISFFINNWTMTNNPPMTSNTISIMKESLELGISARFQLQTYASDTNVPHYLRLLAGMMVTNLLYNAQ